MIDQDDLMNSDVEPSMSWSSMGFNTIKQEAHRHQINEPQQPKHHQQQQQNSLRTTNITTDYESSAAEDYETYTLSKYENAEYALLSYSRTNKLDKLQVLLDAKSRGEISLDLNYKGQQKQNFSWSALHLACYFGHIKVVELFLSKKQFRDELDINIQNNSGDTPLHKAAFTNRAEIVQLLLSHGANVFIHNCDGLLAKELTKNNYISDMLEAAEQVDRNKTIKTMLKAVDNGDLKKLQEYFDSFGSYFNKQRSETVANENQVKGDQSAPDQAHPSYLSQSISSNDFFKQIIDERGNTLLHIATMRGFKAICVYLLEQGFDPYRKNNLGQSSLDLSSYQLRQLFMTVKPANDQLKRLSNQRVTRFEGPLMRKVRILGWRQIYVVLENGVILLFNNRKDSMNRSRRGYKYLESATCDPEPNDLGTFSVSFSDKSRATFLVTQDHLNNYTSFRSTNQEQPDKSSQARGQIELIRQKWIDAIRDHIRYSTEFIKNGLKLNDYEDENEIYNSNGDLISLNHLLPVDTIKSFTQEARAHYSILERHADSLCNLVQSILANNQRPEANNNDELQTTIENSSPIVSSSTTGSRLLGFIRPSRQSKSNSSSIDEGSTCTNQQTFINNSIRKRNNSLASDFIRDEWHCILFHLRLLNESAENTKETMNQALALIEHQEQLRQNRLQDQEERCRVLEDSLHALARDHHELEKSISMSQVYHSAAVRSLSMSMSTDLNEYHDAFEDFDDDNTSRTLTPTSTPSDEDLRIPIQEVENEDQQLAEAATGGEFDTENNKKMNDKEEYFRRNEETDEDEDDDLQSNCSALTVETVDDQSILNVITKQTDLNTITALPFKENKNLLCSRTKLPSPMVPRDQVSIWSILKNCIGKELSKITMPVVFNEPLTMLQRACEGVQYSQYLNMADESDDPVERMELICAFIVAGLSANCHRIIKPFNPLLYETYEYIHELNNGSQVKTMAQQVSHHPPITAAYSESQHFIYNGSVNPKIKFWGRSIEVHPDGQCRIILKRHNETYVFKSVSCSVHNIIVGKLWFEHCGPLDIKCLETKIQANLTFHQAGWFSKDLHRFDGYIVSDEGKNKLRYVYGKWSDYIKSVDYSEYKKFIQENPQKIFRIPDSPDHEQSNGFASNSTNSRSHSSSNSINNNSIKSATQVSGEVDDRKSNFSKNESNQALDIPKSRMLWKLESEYLDQYYNFTYFTLKLNELTPQLESELPRTDSRFRIDVRKLEEGDLDGAASEKQRLEEKQREARARDKRFKEPSSELLWFNFTEVPHSKEKFWMYKGGYWENRKNPDRFPDLF